jgi:hypothetical protein
VIPGQRDPLEVRRVAAVAGTGAELLPPLEALHAAQRDAGDRRGVWGAARALKPNRQADWEAGE